jgi:uncharacterized Fe-S cluster-containing radical SAM superfamily protein
VEPTNTHRIAANLLLLPLLANQKRNIVQVLVKGTVKHENKKLSNTFKPYKHLQVVSMQPKQQQHCQIYTSAHSDKIRHTSQVHAK